jgi:putative SOS response-associated peptidase YedK
VSNRCSLLNAAEGSVKIFVDPRFGNHRILTVTEDYQMRVDSILSANPYQSNQGNNRLFSFANLYKKWAAGGDTTVFNGLGLKQE